MLGLGVALALVLGLATYTADAAESSGGISGTVTSASGQAPIEGLEVCAARAGDEAGGRFCATTNAEGEYAISALPTGSYWVEFSAEREYECGSKRCVQLYYLQYYNDKPRPGEAEPVSVVAGSTTPGIDAQMVEWGSVRVIGPEAGPYPSPPRPAQAGHSRSRQAKPLP
jgi:hypothetical protein